MELTKLGKMFQGYLGGKHVPPLVFIEKGVTTNDYRND